MKNKLLITALLASGLFAHDIRVWDPFIEIQKEMKTLQKSFPKSFRPSLDMVSDNKFYTIKVELPGLDLKDISLEVLDSKLYIKGKKEKNYEAKTQKLHRIERSYGEFSRIVYLPKDASANGVESSYKNGVLSITLNKIDIPKPKKIEIKQI
ncbi:MAG: Heat shock protein Hsp20 [uncultured Campylobacterales bacterium]|uniref:Heat shock protein Hsp20 n=1 Tax=uncultured Campylobacterales bacterium TaxID=352960 RepID=A0A6S6T143_9BACT|nr:MAG: Heat shock protein Hsp20 [uncultured Campylobacterales bacterium]